MVNLQDLSKQQLVTLLKHLYEKEEKGEMIIEIVVYEAELMRRIRAELEGMAIVLRGGFDD